MSLDMLEVLKRWTAEMAARASKPAPRSAYEKSVQDSQTAHEQSETRITPKTVQISWKPAANGPVQDARERLAEEGRTAHLRGSPDRITSDSADRVSRTDKK